MKEIVIEETISQTFEVPDDASVKDVEEMYRQGKLVLDNLCVTNVAVQMNPDESWIDIH